MSRLQTTSGPKYLHSHVSQQLARILSDLGARQTVEPESHCKSHGSEDEYRHVTKANGCEIDPVDISVSNASWVGKFTSRALYRRIIALNHFDLVVGFLLVCLLLLTTSVCFSRRKVKGGKLSIFVNPKDCIGELCRMPYNRTFLLAEHQYRVRFTHCLGSLESQ